MEECRTKKSIRNSGMSALAQIVSIILNFIGRTIFIKILNVDYLGVNGLFSDILSLMSLAEMGVGTAIIYMMYAPIATGNYYKIAAYNLLFRKIYNCIGVFIFLAGLCVVPFFNSFIKETPNIDENLNYIYILFLLNTSISYFFTYKRSLLIAYQKEYLNSKNIIFFAVVKDVVFIVVLLLTANYYLYLFSQIVVTFLSNYAVSKIADKEFPNILCIKDATVSKSEIKTIVKNTTAMLCHKIGSVVVTGTDNILISSFVGIGAVGLFSNYRLIQTVCQSVTSKASNAVTASVGNMVATDDSVSVYNMFKKLYFINFSVAYFLSVFYLNLVDPFLRIWLGESFLLSKWTVLLIAVNLFLNQVRIPSQVLINTYGVFWQIKWKSIVEAIINLLSSLCFVMYFELGIVGILLGTLVSNLCTNIWWEPFVAFKYGLRISVFGYYCNFMVDCIVFIITIVATLMFHHYAFEHMGELSSMIVIFLVTTMVSILIFLMFYRKRAEFNYMSILFCKIKSMI